VVGAAIAYLFVTRKSQPEEIRICAVAAI